MKTLRVETNGLIEFSFDGEAFNTDTSDENIPAWALSGINVIISQLETDGSNYVHFEDNGYQVLKHKRRMGVVEIWNDPIPDVFTNVSRMLNEYKAADANQV